MSSSTPAVEEAENNGKKGKAGRIIGSIALIVLVFISVFLLFAAMWLIKSFAGVTTEEIVYHLSYSMEGANTESATDYLLHYAIPTLIIVGILVAAYFLIISKVKTKKALLIANFGMVLVSLGCIAGCVLLLVKKTDVINYISGLRGDNSFIEDNYVDTQSVQLTFPEKKRNLIYIYMESMEVTYSDKENGGAFEVNLIPELTQLSKDNIDFSGNDTELNGGLAYSGAQWTMGAMFTMSTGLPLKTSLPDPNDLDTQENMYPGVVAIGDILKNEGLAPINAKVGVEFDPKCMQAVETSADENVPITIYKKVTRFNCLMEGESMKNLNRRVKLAQNWYFYAEKYMALYFFI